VKTGEEVLERLSIGNITVLGALKRELALIGVMNLIAFICLKGNMPRFETLRPRIAEDGDH